MLPPLASLIKLDIAPRHRQPLAGRLVLASVLAIVFSLVADAILVAAGKAMLPGIKGYSHFRFTDYAKLTVIGVVIACVAWPIVARVTSAPRWLFLRLAVLVTLVLLLPNIYILYGGQPVRAVAVLMVMHLAIALVTYNLLVHVAPVRPSRRGLPDADALQYRAAGQHRATGQLPANGQHRPVGQHRQETTGPRPRGPA